ncbi:MAG TPA: hypothetical protein VFS37_08855 [Conexibacter sp.]|nr:hypothetical protein [Conexibacter sp.]
MTEPPQLDLDVKRDATYLVATTLVLFARHALLFLSVTLLVVAPVVILVNGIWAGRLAGGGAAEVPIGALAATAALGFMMPVLVTGLHVAIVRDLGEGRVPTVKQALRAAAPRLPHAVAAVFVYTLLTIGGFLLLIVPGIWVLVAGYFVAQATVIERRGPLDAFRRSSELVDDRWWRTAGTLLLGWVLLTIASYPVGRIVDAIDAGVTYIVLYTVLQVLTLSLSALFGTLMYFSLRAEQARPSDPAPPVTYLPPMSPTPAAQPPVDL